MEIADDELDFFYPTSRARLRSVATLMVDCTIPRGIDGDIPEDRDFFPKGARFYGVLEVLTTIPDAPYQQLKAKVGTFVWDIPRTCLWGCVSPPRYQHVVYLSPLLEFVESQAAVVGLVAHELAHLVLGHGTGSGDIHEYMANETAVESQVSEWGFGLEGKAMAELSKYKV